MTYFAYVHAKPKAVNSSDIFYVGKGRGKRYLDLTERNRFHGFITKKHGKESILVGKIDCSSEEIAFELEKGLIKCLRRAGVNLTNMTDGGDGSSGYVMPQESRDKMSIAIKEVHKRPEYKAAKREETRRTSTERWASEGYRKRVCEAMKGKKKTMSQAGYDARVKNARKSNTPEANAKKANAAKAMWADPKFRKMMSEKRKASWQDPIKRENMLANRPNKKS